MKVLGFLLALSWAATASAGNSWTGWGGSILNNHWADDNTHIKSSTIPSLTLKCKIRDTVGESAPPTICGSYAYYPTWNGSFVALNYKTCEVKWRVNVTQIINDFKPISSLQAIANVAAARTSPQIDAINNVLFFGTQIHALLVAVDLDTGALVARKQVNPHELATITASLSYYDSIIFAAVSSGEENAGVFTNGTYPCCSFIGNAAAFRFHRTGSRGTGTFTTVWNITTIPPNLPVNGTGRWSGAGIWGSQPSVDTARNQIFFATGNIYSIPDAYTSCTESSDPNCIPSYIWQESVFAIDIYTGHTNWVRRLNRLDAWNLICGAPGLPGNATLCPWKPGNDSDFGMAPTLIKGNRFTPGHRDLLTIGQKSGILYGLAADTGAVLWSKLTSPGSSLAGLIWGVAADDKRAYFTGVNWEQVVWPLQPGGSGSGSVTTNNSIWGAASLTDGSLVWEVPTPGANMSTIVPVVVGDLVITGVDGPFGFTSPGPGAIVALNKDTGVKVFEYALDGPFAGALSVQDKYLFLGTGYKSGSGGDFWVFKVA